MKTPALFLFIIDTNMKNNGFANIETVDGFKAQ